MPGRVSFRETGHRLLAARPGRERVCAVRSLWMWKYCFWAAALMNCALFVPHLFGEKELPETTLPAEEVVESVAILPPGEVDGSYSIRVLDGDAVKEMTMAEYLRGVVRAEMPAAFEQEALCAQAVAARTYTLYKIASGGSHGDTADICTDPACCQAYLEESAAAANWGIGADRYAAKIKNAVAATDGQTVTYGGAPILAVFHSSAAGRTRPSGEVWSSDLPYLQSVESPEDADGTPNYCSRTEVDAEAFRETFLAAHPEAVFSDDPETWIGDAVITSGMHVDTLTVGGVTVRGVEMRKLYSLRSAAFETEVQDGKIVFHVTGYGHGVGMSQYGANAMAAEGANWEEIILHYYTGVTIETRGG